MHFFESFSTRRNFPCRMIFSFVFWCLNSASWSLNKRKCHSARKIPPSGRWPWGRFPLGRIFHGEWYFLLSFDAHSLPVGLQTKENVTPCRKFRLVENSLKCKLVNSHRSVAVFSWYYLVQILDSTRISSKPLQQGHFPNAPRYEHVLWKTSIPTRTSLNMFGFCHKIL